MAQEQNRAPHAQGKTLASTTSAMHIAAWVCAALALLAALPCVPHFPLLIGPLAFADAPQLASLAFGLLCPLLLLMRKMHGNNEKAPARTRFASVFAVIVSCICILAGAFHLATLDAKIMEPSSPSGDRVVVVERHLLLSSSGTVYFAPFACPFGIPAGTFYCDDAYSPLRANTVSVQWRGRNAAVSVWSDSAADPMQRFNVVVGPYGIVA